MARPSGFLSCVSLAGLLAFDATVHAVDFGPAVIETVDAAALKGIKRVAVTSFTVQYVTSQIWDTSFTSGGAAYGVKGAGGGFNIADALDPEKMQSTTDKLYQGFLTDLQSAGFDVVSVEQMTASKAYKDYERDLNHECNRCARPTRIAMTETTITPKEMLA